MSSTATTLPTSRIAFGDPGIDHPEQRTMVDVLLASRRDLLTSVVEEVRDGELLVTVGQDKSQRPVRLDVGERMELVWKAGGEMRSLPVELLAVTPGEVSTWLVRAVGAADRGQRRRAVRAPLALPVVLRRGDDTLIAGTSDVSEGGLRCTLAAPSGGKDALDIAAAAARKKQDLQAGDTLRLQMDLSGGQVECAAEVVRRHRREDGRTEVSLRLVDISEATEDLIRRDVFACLRDLRVRGVL